MSQSKHLWIFPVSVYIVFSLLLLACFFPEACCDEFGNVAGMCYDAAHSYAIEIGGLSPVDNWHSALFMLSGRLIRFFLITFLNWEVDGYEAVRLMWVLSSFVLIGNVSVWIYIMSAECKYPKFLFIPFVAAQSVLYRFCQLDLSFFFVALLSVLITVLHLSFIIKRKLLYCIIIIGLFLLSVIMVDLRRNSLLLVPCLAYLIIPLEGTWRKCIVSITLAFGVYLGGMMMVKMMPGVEQRFPLTPMIESELRIAHLLRGEGGSLRKKLEQVGYKDSGHSYLNSLTAYCAGDWERGRNIDTEKVRELYIQEIIRHPLHMATAKVLLIVQFYTGGGTPSLVRKMVGRFFPSVNENADAWKPLTERHIVLWFSRLVILVWVGCIGFKLSNNIKKYRLGKSLLSIAVMVVVYSVSFVVVTPTADTRYLTPSLFFAIPLIWVWYCGGEKHDNVPISPR